MDKKYVITIASEQAQVASVGNFYPFSQLSCLFNLERATLFRFSHEYWNFLDLISVFIYEFEIGTTNNEGERT